MIKVSDISVTLGREKIFNKVNCIFENSFVHGIIGHNGAGKTTFFNVLSRIQKIDSGNITFQDHPMTHSDVGYLEANNYFYSKITGNEYLSIFPETNTHFDITLFNQLMKLPLNDLVETYSNGMKKKLALLGILKQNKPIIIMDEPFNSLDLESVKMLELVILKLKQQKKTIFISSHIIDTLVPICDFIHLIEMGVFKRKYAVSEFDRIEEHLLGHFKLEAMKIIEKSM